MVSMRILIVEDEVKLASLIRRGLREEGLLADVAIRGEDALWMAGSSEYDVIVLSPASTSWSPGDCWRPSRRRRSRSRWPRLMRSPTAERAPTARSSCGSSAPAMTPRVPSARFTPASPRTASSPAASRPAGSKSCANSPRQRPNSPSRPRPHRSPHASSSKRSRATCRRCGPPTAHRRKTASGCCAR